MKFIKQKAMTLEILSENYSSVVNVDSVISLKGVSLGCISKHQFTEELNVSTLSYNDNQNYEEQTEKH